jgi:hypothetical protein
MSILLLASSIEPNPAQVSNDHFGIIVGGIVAVFVAICSAAAAIIPLLVKTKNAAAEKASSDVSGTVKLNWLVAAVTYLLERDQQGDSDTNRRQSLIENRPEGHVS